MSKNYKLRLPIPFADDFARDSYVKAFRDVFKGFPREEVVGLAEGRYLKIIGEMPIKAIAWWLEARGIPLEIIEITEAKVTLTELGYLEV